VLVFAAIDKLWKGAASQAVQDLNLMLGLPEGEGLGATATRAAAPAPASARSEQVPS
jgi:N-acetyl-gamma-glutamylphosphate reductase